jgi:uncharacterized alpha-E superfamily protein
MLNSEFPRSVRFCLDRLDESVRAITGTPPGFFANSAGQLLGQFLADLSYASVEQIMRTGLHEYIDRLQTRLNEVDQAIYSSFFDLTANSGG